MSKIDYSQGPRRPEEGIFRCVLRSPLEIRGVYLRRRFAYQNLYHEDPDDLVSLGYLQEFVKCCKYGVYLVARDGNRKRAAEVAAKEGVIFNRPEVMALDHRNVRVEFGDGTINMLSVVDLQDFSFRSNSDLVLNFVNSVVVITDFGIDWVASKCTAWSPERRPLAFFLDYDKMAADLGQHESLAFLRYFSGDNAYDEQIAAIGTKSFLDENVYPCLIKVREGVLPEWVCSAAD